MNVSFAFDGGQLSRATWELLPSCKHTLFECCSEMKLTLSLSKLFFSRSTLWAALLIASANGNNVTIYGEDIDLQLEVSHLSFVLLAETQTFKGKGRLMSVFPGYCCVDSSPFKLQCVHVHIYAEPCSYCYHHPGCHSSSCHCSFFNCRPCNCGSFHQPRTDKCSIDAT